MNYVYVITYLLTYFSHVTDFQVHIHFHDD